MYIYIQSIAAYLSPPIAMIFCLAISWPRMNEAGAFWGLMIGLIIGVLRMVMDFSYPEPLCMEHDTRPSIVANVSLSLLVTTLQANLYLCSIFLIIQNYFISSSHCILVQYLTSLHL